MSNGEDPNTQNIVDEHRKMVVMTGNISDFQIENLKKWPFLVFGKDLKTVQIDYDFVQGDEDNGSLYAGRVNYDFDFEKEPEATGVSLDMLRHWTKYMFWEDTKVTFTKKGKEWPTK